MKSHILSLLLLATAGHTAEITPELNSVIQDFLNAERTSIRIQQVIDWRFAGKNDTVSLVMDIKEEQRFRVTLPGFGMEVFVADGEMITLNHARRQLIREKASPDALLEQLFVGGDLRDARFKREKRVKKTGGRKLDFVFSSDFSDWDSMSLFLNAKDRLDALTLVDYDGNEYLITLDYLSDFQGFTKPEPETDYPGYQIADLRDK